MGRTFYVVEYENFSYLPFREIDWSTFKEIVKRAYEMDALRISVEDETIVEKLQKLLKEKDLELFEGDAFQMKEKDVLLAIGKTSSSKKFQNSNFYIYLNTDQGEGY